LVKTPHVSVRISADLYAVGKDKLQEIAQARGFEGRLVVQPDAALTPGDCRIEWSEGGVNRDRAAMLAAVGDAVARYVAARAATTH
jgi:flagellar assembly protein FliH